MTTPTLTTGGPPPPGYNGIALLFTSFDVVVAPEVVMRLVHDTVFNVAVTPQLSMLGPQSFFAQVSPTIFMRGGSTATSSYTIDITPTISMSAGIVPTTSFTIDITAAVSMAANVPKSLPRQLNVAVTRAATI